MIACMGKDRRPPGEVIAGGPAWWLTAPDDPRGWRRAHWALVRAPGRPLVFWHGADDGGSSATAELDGMGEDDAVAWCRDVIRDTDLAHLRHVTRGS
jgi:hypothetical protein